jgi:acetyltransferase-like isoleucine patch superfamily enzyme
MRMLRGFFSSMWRIARSKSIWIESMVCRCYLNLWGVSVGKNFTMRSLPYCRTVGTGRIIIGDNVKIKNKLSENPAGINHRTILVAGNGAVIAISNNVGISGSTIYALESVTIGDGCMLGANSMIYTTDFHPLHADDRRERVPGATETGPVVLEDNVWVGANAVILKGITIGKGSVIAIGSIVTKDVPQGVIAGGNPARVIRPVSADRYAPH